MFRSYYEQDVTASSGSFMWKNKIKEHLDNVGVSNLLIMEDL